MDTVQKFLLEEGVTQPPLSSSTSYSAAIEVRNIFYFESKEWTFFLEDSS
jgi:hypothetical protein